MRDGGESRKGRERKEGGKGDRSDGGGRGGGGGTGGQVREERGGGGWIWERLRVGERRGKKEGRNGQGVYGNRVGWMGRDRREKRGCESKRKGKGDRERRGGEE